MLRFFIVILSCGFVIVEGVVSVVCRVEAAAAICIPPVGSVVSVVVAN